MHRLSALERGLAVLVEVLAPARAEDERTDEGGNAADHVNERRSREVHIVHAGKGIGEPAAAPHPVRLDGIDDCADDERINAIGEELGALCHRARDDRRRGGAEHEVEEEVRPVVRLEVGDEVKIGNAHKSGERVFPHQESRTQKHEYHRAEAEVH